MAGFYDRKMTTEAVTKSTESLDLQLKKELAKIDYSRYLDYGSIKVTVRKGQMTLTTIERTYPD